MPNQFPRGPRRRLAFRTTWTIAGFLLTAVGCGFPHDRYQSDALLGQFNRPIAPTPPIWTGGDPGVSPAYDAGARMGLPSPDVPARSNPILDRMFILPTFSGTLGIGNLYNGGANGASSANGGSPAGQQGGATSATPRSVGPVTSAGAQLMPNQPAVERGTFISGIVASPGSVKPRTIDTSTILTSGSSIEPSVAAPKPLSPMAGMKDPRTVVSVEEGQMVLQTCGARSMTMESQPTGEWRFICNMGEGGDGGRRYEAQSGDQIEAVRAVLWQVKNDH